MFRAIRFWILETFRERYVAVIESKNGDNTCQFEWNGPGDIVYRICWDSVMGDDNPYLFDDWCNLCMADNTKEKTPRLIEDIGNYRACILFNFCGLWLLLHNLGIPRFMNQLSSQWAKMKRIYHVIVWGIRFAYQYSVHLDQSIRIIINNIRKVYLCSED